MFSPLSALNFYNRSTTKLLKLVASIRYVTIHVYPVKAKLDYFSIMSDSLREQMLKAGFKEPASDTKKRSGKSQKNKSGQRGQASGTHQSRAPKQQAGPSSIERATIEKRKAEAEQIAERKRVKAEIKSLIDTDKIDDTKGEIAHSYVIGKRIKQMFVSETIRKQLLAGTSVITRLNGATYIIPSLTGEKVCTLNPDWVVVTPSSEAPSEDDDYADFQVPDDLTW